MNSDAIAKINMINGSMRCFVFGLLAMLPAIGLPFAVASLVYAGRVRVAQKRFWNPARAYWLIGQTCASLVTLFWVGIAAVIAFAIILQSVH